MSELPKGWVESSLIDLAKFIDYRGRTPKKTEEGIPLITAKNIKDGFINREPREFIAEADYDGWMTRGIPKVGDVLLTTEAPLGNVAQIDIEEKFALAQRAICFQFYESEVERFIYYYLRSPLFNQELGLNSTGSTVKGIKAATLKKLPVHIAPLAEQKRIVEKLDEVLAQVDTIKARLDGIPALLKRFRQSVLASAVSGKLTEEWREENGAQKAWDTKFDVKLLTEHVEPYCLPENWNWDNLGNLVSVLNSKRKPIKQADRNKRQGDYPYYGAFGIIDHIDDYVFDGEYILLAEDGKNLEQRSRPIALIAKGKYWVNNHAHVLDVKTQIDIKYLCYFLNSPHLVIDEFLTGQDQVKLNKVAMVKLPIPVPPYTEQKEIVSLVDQYFAFADTIEAQVKKAQVRVDNLTQSILAKAFRGELVAQDPNDEPTDKLLERIAAARKEAEALTKAAKKAGASKEKANKAAVKG